MSFPRYPEYKDSGVEWLEEVPEHWELVPLKQVISRIESGTSVNAIDTPAGDGELGVLKTSCVYHGHFDADENKAVILDEYDRVACPVTAGTLVVSRMNTPDLVGAAGVVHVSHANLFLPDRLWQVHFDGADPNFVHHWTHTPAYRAQVEMACAGTSSSMQNLGQDQFRSFVIPRPSFGEQTAIATFLDHETTKIDVLVAEQEKLIAMLQEKRQAVISHAVTKGLDPNVPMKDSGVEWLGEVPGHWEIKRIKHLVVALEQGWSPQCEGFAVQSDEEWGVLKVGCVNGGVFRPEENKALPPELEPIPDLSLAAGDLLISRANTRELVGGAAVAMQDYPRLMLCDKLYRIRLHPDTCEPRFLALYLGTPQIRGQIELAATGASSSMLNIGQSTILELEVVLPPLDEQRTILNAVSAQSARAGALVAQARSAINLLQERRTALISAAVTGQIDVRGLVGGAGALYSIAASAYPASAGG